jgi:hypothetical protein
MRETDFRPSVLPIPLALILAIGARPAAGQTATGFIKLGPENIGCATPPITLNPAGFTLSPNPAGYGPVNGVFLIWPEPTSMPPVPLPVPIYSLASSSSFGASGGCCNPGPSTIYSAMPNTNFVSPFEWGTFSYPDSMIDQQVWVQELIMRPAAPFNPCTIYVTNQVVFMLH